MSTAPTAAGSEQTHSPLPLPWEGTMTVAAMGIVVAVLVRCTDHVARTSDGAVALTLSRSHEWFTTVANALTGPAVMTLLAVVGAAVAGAGPFLSARLIFGAWPAPAERPGRAAIIVACAVGAASVFTAGFLYTAIVSTMTAPSIPAAAGAEVCGAIAAGCALIHHRSHTTSSGGEPAR
ncbi:hypothetical protein [Rhodococcus sp. NPDC006774]|uniref:hypothetical protein n=1 Tax=Rhodococcus sp. NPDC006774 TaxID=3157186 RepID=UPI0033FCFB2F